MCEATNPVVLKVERVGKHGAHALRHPGDHGRRRRTPEQDQDRLGRTSAFTGKPRNVSPIEAERAAMP